MSAPGRKHVSWGVRALRAMRLAEGPLADRGERYAAKYLRQQGMRIIARNRRVGRGEVDLIALDGEWVVFVEVRTRTSEKFMTPEGSIRFRKKRDMAKAADQLLREVGRKGYRPRIDVVAVVWPEGVKRPTVRHYAGAIGLHS